MGEEKIHNNNHGYTSVDVKKPETKRSQMTFRERWCSCSRGVERNRKIFSSYSPISTIFTAV